MLTLCCSGACSGSKQNKVARISSTAVEILKLGVKTIEGWRTDVTLAKQTSGDNYCLCTAQQYGNDVANSMSNDAMKGTINKRRQMTASAALPGMLLLLTK